jgi:hypothetical protein
MKEHDQIYTTFNFCCEKGNLAETGCEFILYNQTDICPLPAA